MSATTGKELYQVYGDMVDFKNFQGNPMPEWEALPPKIQEAWDTVAAHIPDLGLTDREWAQINHADTYSKLYSDAGAPGHNQYLLIAKLASALGLIS